MSFVRVVVLITDASFGIGAQVAFHFAKLGASVSIVDRNEKQLNEVAENIQRSGSPVPLAIVGDVTKEAERIIAETLNHFGQLNVLVNNTEMVLQDSASKTSVSDFERLFDTNVRSVITQSICLTKICMPHLAKTKGNVINVTTVAGLKTKPNIMTYMSKAALEQVRK